jgi:hypothetical protein
MIDNYINVIILINNCIYWCCTYCTLMQKLYVCMYDP